LLSATGGGAYGFGAVNTSIAGALVNLSLPATGWAAGGGVDWVVVPTCPDSFGHRESQRSRPTGDLLLQ
jgi:hypothetical protein